MNTTDWRTLRAGAELDALFAMRVMGHQNYPRGSSRWYDDHDEWYPASHMMHYSTDIADLWWGVERMEKRGFRLALKRLKVPHADGSVWQAQFYGRPLGTEIEYGATAPLAIVRAALAATEAA